MSFKRVSPNIIPKSIVVNKTLKDVRIYNNIIVW